MLGSYDSINLWNLPHFQILGTGTVLTERFDYINITMMIISNKYNQEKGKEEMDQYQAIRNTKGYRDNALWPY